MSRTRFSKPRARPGLIFLLALMVGLLGSSQATAVTYYFGIDVPSTLGGTTFTPSQIVRGDGAGYSLAQALTPGCDLSALAFRSDGRWLFSPASPVTLGPMTYEPRDIVVYDGFNYSMLQDGSAVGIPASARVDALLLDAGGAPVMSFDVPVNLGGTEYGPSDLVRFANGVFTLYWDAEAQGVPAGSNLVGADLDGAGNLIVSFDVPTRIGATDWLPGQLVQWTPGLFASYLVDPSWPRSAQLRDFVIGADLGGFVWDDLNQNGLRDPGEPGHAGVQVRLLGSAGILNGRLTLADGSYRFPLPASGTFQLQFLLPAGYALTYQDQGDDLIDSDPIRTQGITDEFVLSSSPDEAIRWSAGLVACSGPDDPVEILGSRTVPGFNTVILDFTDPNPGLQVTGYNVFRSDQPQPPPAPWTLLASDVMDQDPVTPDLQWYDASGTPPPGTVYFYQITAVHHDCGSEGPR